MAYEIHVKVKILALPSENFQYVLNSETTILDLKNIISKQFTFNTDLNSWKILYLGRICDENETIGEINNLAENIQNLSDSENSQNTQNSLHKKKLVFHLSCTEFSKNQALKSLHFEEQKAIHAYKLCYRDILYFYWNFIRV